MDIQGQPQTGFSTQFPLLSFSVVVPTYNEETDIRRTCEALASLKYPNKEIIIVDNGSTDNTVPIVSEFVERYGFKLLYQPIRGVGAARNLGIREASGDIVVILNADVFPAPDFLNRIWEHYVHGADFLAVDSQVANLQGALGRYAQAMHLLHFGGDKPVGWTEGFSCRKQVAVEAGLFPEEIPVPCGEDVIFYNNLVKVCPGGIVDKSIVVPHVAPGDLRSYWRQQLTRGWGAPYIRYYICKDSLAYLVARMVLATGVTLALLLLVFPTLIRAIRLSVLSPRGYRDFLAFLVIDMLRVILNRYGQWCGFAELVGKVCSWSQSPCLE